MSKTTVSKKTALCLAAAALALSACSTVSNLNPFNRGGGNQSVATPGDRVPILGLDETLAPADALQGQDFFLPPPSAVAQWPLPGGTPAQSLEHVEAARDFSVAWRRSFGLGSKRNRHVTATPVVAGGRIYALDAQATVTALDARTGARLWSRDLRPRERRDRDGYGGGVAYADGRVYVTSGFRFVAALDAATGDEVWRTQVEAPIHGAPTVADGRVFAVNIDDNLASFDARTGAQGWNYQAIVEPARILASSSPAISGDVVIAAFGSGELVALRAANGTDLWSQVLSRANRTNALSEIRDVPGRPVVFRDRVLAASHSGVFASMDVLSGQQRWSLPVASITTPWAAGDVVYIVSKDGQLICASRESGLIYWIQNLNEGRNAKQRAYWYGPVLASGRLVLVSSKGEIEARDPKTGVRQSSLRAGGPVLQTPIAADGTLYVVTDDADIVAIR